jgi:hypothetical protein
MAFEQALPEFQEFLGVLIDIIDPEVYFLQQVQRTQVLDPELGDTQILLHEGFGFYPVMGLLISGRDNLGFVVVLVELLAAYPEPEPVPEHLGFLQLHCQTQQVMDLELRVLAVALGQQVGPQLIVIEIKLLPGDDQPH